MQLNELFRDIERIVDEYKRGKSSNQIARETGYSQTFVSEVIRKLGLTRPPGWYWVGRRNPNWNQPNLHMSPHLAYILGVLYGDGTIDKKRAHIRLSATNRRFVESFAEAIKGIGLKPHKIYAWKQINTGLPDYTPKRPTTYYRTGFVSKAFKNWFNSLTLKTVEILLDKPEFMREFIRGIYESEGTYSPPHNGRTSVEIVNTDYELIQLCKRLLEKLGFKTSRITVRKRKPPRKPLYRLSINRKEEVERFLREIKPVIKNK